MCLQVSIDTACSSAMVAVHSAAQNIYKTKASALAGAVNLMLAESTTAAAFSAGMLTADGRCKTLDASADGYVRAEACIMLKLDPTEQSIGLGETNETAFVIAASHVNQASGRDCGLWQFELRDSVLS